MQPANDPAELIYERVLVVRAMAGDEGAFAELVARYSPRLRYFLSKLLATGGHDAGLRGADAEDLLQEVWLAAFRHLPRLSDPRALRAWLYRIARDGAYGRLRKERGRTQSLEDGEVVDPASEAEECFSAEDAAEIHAALDKLPAEQREVLVLRFVEDMSYEEIAQVVHCQLGTVRSRIHYGKRALRGLIERGAGAAKSG